MAQKLNKKNRKVQVQLENVTIETQHDSDNERLDIQIEDLYICSRQRDSPIRSNFEEAWDPEVNVNISNSYTNINSSDKQNTTILEKTVVKSFSVSHTESDTEEVKTQNINVELFNKDTNVNMDEGCMTQLQNFNNFMLDYCLTP
ncbi:unnamed protein product [Lactuca saligna]|uniref:Uncharacterized protein n=1 Tax=Lactuca saligna TaxID=75948 RepID=A0AA36E457_LACSI|nr:unnamed protein product [Lactuca saligna]